MASDVPALGLRHVIFGGEALDLRRLRIGCAPRRRCPRMVNMYGIDRDDGAVAIFAWTGSLRSAAGAV